MKNLVKKIFNGAVGTMGSIALIVPLLVKPVEAASKEDVSKLIKSLKSTSEPRQFEYNDIKGTSYQMTVDRLKTDTRGYRRVDILFVNYENYPDQLKVIGLHWDHINDEATFYYIFDGGKKEGEIERPLDGKPDFEGIKNYTPKEMVYLADRGSKGDYRTIDDFVKSVGTKDVDPEGELLYNEAVKKALEMKGGK